MSHLDDALDLLPVRLTVGQAAEFLDVGTKQVYELVRDGRLPAYKPTGHRWIVLREDLRDWIKAGSNQQGDHGNEE